MCAFALASFRASISVEDDLDLFFKTFASVSTYIAGYHCLQKTLILLALKLIMAQSTDPPDIEQSQKYRVTKNAFFCV